MYKKNSKAKKSKDQLSKYDKQAVLKRGLLSQGLAAEPEEVLAQGRTAIAKAIRVAADTSGIPAISQEDVGKLFDETLPKQAAEKLLEPASSGHKPSIGDLLSTMPVRMSAGSQLKVAEIIAQKGINHDKLHNQLESKGVKGKQAVRVRRTLRLGDLTLRNTALMKQLQQITRNETDASLKALTEIESDEWIDKAYEFGVPAGSGMKPEEYARHLEAAVEKMHPARVLEAKLNKGSIRIPRSDFEKIGAFLKSYSSFDILNTNIPVFLQNAKLVKTEDKQQLGQALLKLRRIKKLSASWDEAAAILNQNLDSVPDIVNMGLKRLQQRLAGAVRPERAAAIYKHACMTHNFALALMSGPIQGLSAASVTAMGMSTRLSNESMEKDYPSLSELFGPLDSMQNDKDRTVLSPAAYYVDLLQFLKNAGDFKDYGEYPTRSVALNALLKRRPDLADLVLSSANTGVEIPYIDLVLEILENAVALPLNAALPKGMSGEDGLKAEKLPPEISDLLQMTSLEQISKNLKAEKQQKKFIYDDADAWIVADSKRRWTLHNTPGSLVIRNSGRYSANHRVVIKQDDLKETYDKLDKGKLTPEIIEHIEAFLKQKKYSRYFPIAGYSVKAVEAGRQWEVRCRRGIKVTVNYNKGKGILTIKNKDNEEIFSREYSQAALEVIITGLEKGEIKGPLGALLSFEDHCQVIHGDHENSWDIDAEFPDVVIVVMEPDNLSVTALSYQTADDGSEMKASPANLNPLAYELLKLACFPWSLPFDLPLEAVRALLRHTGITRRQLLEACKPVQYLADPVCIREVLGISLEEADIIANAAEDSQLWKNWGLKLDAAGNTLIIDASAEEAKKSVSGTPLEVMSRVSILMQQARLSYDELLMLLNTKYISLCQPGYFQFDNPVEYRISKMKITNLEPDHLDRLHRFIRLWRKTGWKPDELDMAVYAFSPVYMTPPPDKRRLRFLNITADTLAALSNIKRLQELLSLPLKVLISWWDWEEGLFYSSYNCSGQRKPQNLYEQIFLNPHTGGNADPDFALNEKKTALLNQGGKSLGEKLLAVSAALGIRPEDCQSIIDILGLEDKLTYKNLFELYRTAGFIRGLELPFAQYAKLKSLTDNSPFSSPGEMIKHIEIIKLLQNCGFTPDELTYLLKHEITPGLQLTMSNEKAAGISTAVRSAIQAGINLIKQRTDSLNEASDETIPLNMLSDSNIRVQLCDIIASKLANLFNLNMAVVQRLVLSGAETGTAILKCPSDPSKAAADVFLDPLYINGNDDTEDVIKVIYLLHKASIIITRLGIKPVQIPLLANDTYSMFVLNINDLPVGPTAGGNSLLPNWLRMTALFKLCNSIPGIAAVLVRYAAELKTGPFNNIKGTLHTLIAEALSLDAGMFDEAVPKACELLGITGSDHYRDPLMLEQLLKLLHIIKRLGVKVKDIMELIAESPSIDSHKAARSLLCSKYGGNYSGDIVKPVFDALRIQQRDALTDYLMAKHNCKDANELYEYFLIDTQMSANMLTSRLVQATASIQQFVQRCLLNLEDEEIKLHEDDRKQWEWIKNYRVWEANRKVFLYPENWLYPELRDDKSQLFKELESGIAQGEPAYQLAKDDMLVYLDEMAEVSKIKVFGMYDLYSETGRHTLYVVGRMPDQPYNYYWRKCENFSEPDVMQWSGWEKIDMDISGDHVMPFIFEGCLNIAWPIMIEATDEYTKEKIWEYRLAWVSRTAKGWSRKKVSKAKLSTKRLLNIPSERCLAFRLETAENSMIFNVYGASEAAAPITQLPADKIIHVEYESDVEINIRVYKEFTLQDGTKVYENTKSPSVSIHAYYDIYEWVQRPYNWNPGKKVLLSQDHDVYLYPLLKDDGMTYSISLKHKHSSYDNINHKTRDIVWKYKQFTVSVSPADDCVRPSDKSYSVEDGTYFYKCDLEVPMACSARSETVNTERRLNMDPVGRFILNASNDVDIEDGSQCPALTKLNCAGSYVNGYKEYPEFSDGTNAFLTVPNALIFDKLPAGRYFTVRAAFHAPDSMCGGIWYYEDNLMKLYIFIKLKAIDNFKNCLLTVAEGHSEARSLRTSAYNDFDGFYLPETQIEDDSGALFDSNYSGNTLLNGSSVNMGINFKLQVPSAIYNWEIFLHAPQLIGEFLTKHHRFEDAQRWLNYIFNPVKPVGEVGSSHQAQYWQFLPFRQASSGATLQELLDVLAKARLNPDDNTINQAALSSIRWQICRWEEKPFSPFAIARMRPTSYQWRTVFAYLDNLIAWGDQLFLRYTRESVNEAIQMYILAAKLLGPHPNSIRPQVQPPALSYRDMYEKWDEFSNAWYSLMDNPAMQIMLNDLHKDQEDAFKNRNKKVDKTEYISGLQNQILALSSLGIRYFCIPYNDKLMEYWDTVEDRLFKIRNCMDFDGIVRELPLFSPPIDPGLLVRATAAGLDIATILADMDAPLLPYRFNIILQKANEICSEVKALGNMLLTAMEKKDSEELALIHSNNEIDLLRYITQVKERQVAEANANIDALIQSFAVVKVRYVQYQKLLGKQTAMFDCDNIPVFETSSQFQPAAHAPGEAAGLGMSQYEVDQLSSLNTANDYMVAAGAANTISSVFHAIPDSISGTTIPVAAHIKIGGSHFGNAAGAVASFLNILAENARHTANKKSIFAQYQRRQDDWVHQSKLAMGEMRQISKQIIAARIRLAISEKELANHKKQIENTQSVNAFMHSKYTNMELYSWMVGEISNIYFSGYQLAYDTAKRAERAFRSELGVDNTGFISFGYWDSMKKGLLVGEKLSLDLKRMELAYLEQNKRELEITKHISLALLDPVQLMHLKESGECSIYLPEALFDMDYPGHYMRRIKSVALSVACVAGPYSGVNCTLTLLGSSSRIKKTLLNDKHMRDISIDDPRFRDNPASVQSMATSHAQNDSGVFELNFHDERYLPFEGAGAISRWKLKLPDKFRQFDYDSIADVIVHLKYTAREGGEPLAGKAVGELSASLEKDASAGFVRFFSIRHEFPNKWAEFKNLAIDGSNTVRLPLELEEEHFPYWSMGMVKSIKEVCIFAKGHMEGTSVGQSQMHQYLGDIWLGQLQEQAEFNIKPLSVKLNLDFNKNLMDDLWLAVTWSSKANP